MFRQPHRHRGDSPGVPGVGRRRAVARLNGRFACALWDGRGAGRLLLARDRGGKKPLYYRHGANQGLAFASALQALLSHDQARRLDPLALEYYLDRGYPPPDRCLVQGFHKVPPGCLLVWEQGRLTDQRYWQFPQPGAPGCALSLAEAGALLREKLTDATHRRLEADAPLGLLLSGGVDSGTLLALMARKSLEPVRTYTACCGGVQFDESELARQTAHYFGARHHALLINPRCGRLLPFVASRMDEPIADSSALATYLICRRARQEVAVLLTGDGADELFPGYPPYRLHALSQAVTGILPDSLRRTLCRFLPPSRGAFFRGEGRVAVPEAILHIQPEDVASWLVENILVKLDKMSMAASVEIRAPFLDQEVVNLAMTLPVGERLGLWRGQQVLSAAVGSLLPRHLSWSRQTPFHLPVDDWLRAEWRPLVKDVLLNDRTLGRGWVEADALRRLVGEHVAGHAAHGRRLYRLLVLEFWARAILDRGQAADPEKVADCARELDPGRPVRRVAVIAPAGIGDTLCLTPGIRQLGRTDPNISMTLYTARGRGSDEVMAGVSPVDRQVPVDFHQWGLRKFLPLLRDLRRNPSDLLVSTLVSRLAWVVGAMAGVKDRRAWVPQWSLSLRLGKFFWRLPRPYRPRPQDVGRQDILAFCDLLGIPAPDPLRMHMAPPLWEENALAQARSQLERLPRPRLAVNAVANPSLPQRQYPLAMLGQALTRLIDRGSVGSVILLGDSYSRDRHGPLMALLGPRGLDLAGKLSLAASAAVMAAGDAVLTIDGGLLHAALATTLPVVALYGPTEIFSTDPRGVPGRYAALSAFRRCRCECLPHRGITAQPACREQSQCLAMITPEEIAAAVTALVSQNKFGAAGSGEKS